jgi:hypothetical protein
MAKLTLTDRIDAAISANNATEGRTPIGRAPIASPARSYFSPTDSYENQIGFDNPQISFAPGAFRGMWSVADQQQASVPTTALKVGNTNSNQTAAIQGGIAKNPVAPATVWAAVPQMIMNLSARGPVVISASVSVQSSVANDTIGVAIYRDGLLIGNHTTTTLPATAGTSALVNLSSMDTPSIGLHTYSMQWSPGTGTLTATSNQRNLYGVNLSPQ